NLLSLSDQGRAMLAKIYEVWREMDDFLAEQIGEEDIRTLAGITLKLRSRLGGGTPGGSPES
ncbi:MAG: hypothetical protein ACQKBU_03030, partial [Verrucomicrobiales bacterium]